MSALIKRNAFGFVFLVVIVFLVGELLYMLLPIFQKMFTDALTRRISADVSVLSLLVFVCAFAYGILRRKWFLVPYSKTLVAYIIYSSALNVYLVLSASKVDYRWILGSIALPLIYLSITGVVFKNRTLVYLLWGVLIIYLVIVISLTFTDANGHFPSLHGVLLSRYRVFMFGNAYGPIALSTLAASTFLLSLGLYLMGFSGNIVSNLFLLVCFGFSAIGLVAASGRASWIGTFAGLLTLIILFRRINVTKKNKNINKKAALRLLFIVIFAIAILFFWGWNNLVQIRFLSLISTLLSPSQDSSLVTRFDLWKSAFRVLIDNPFGVGPSYFEDMYGYSTHNEYLHILISIGVPGFILYFGFVVTNILIILKGAFSRKISEYTRINIIIFPILILVAMVSLTEAWSNSNSMAAVLFWVLLSVGAVASFQHRKHIRETR